MPAHGMAMHNQGRSSYLSEPNLDEPSLAHPVACLLDGSIPVQLIVSIEHHSVQGFDLLLSHNPAKNCVKSKPHYQPPSPRERLGFEEVKYLTAADLTLVTKCSILETSTH